MSSTETMETWSKKILSIEDIPMIYREYYRDLIKNEEKIPYTILTPPQFFFGIKLNEPKLLILLENQIFILEKSKNEIKNIAYKLKEIDYTERGTLLLTSWFKISGKSSNGLSSHKIDFNTVVEELFIKIIHEIRYANSDFGVINPVIEKEKFNYLVNKNFKFMNYGKDSLNGGEIVIQTILQPQRKTKFKKYFTKMSPAHLTILTDKELIIIKDHSRMSGYGNYGAVTIHIPLTRLKKVVIKENNESDIIYLNFILGKDNQITLTFGRSLIDEINSLTGEFEKLLIQADRITETA